MTDPRIGDPPGWVADAVFYQIFPDRFRRSGRVAPPGPLEDWDAPPTVHGFKGGDLYGVIDRLDHLVDLGVTAIYLNPIFSSASNHRYHTYDYLAVDPLLGGDDAFHALLDAAHARGIRVILDGVFNHVGRGFWPFHHVMETGRHSPYRDWFYVSQDYLAADRPLRAYPDEPIGSALPADWGDLHGAGTASPAMYGYRAWWDLPALPKLNTDNPIVREYLMGVAEHWTRAGIDGWRLDVPREITTAGFWPEFRQRVRAINPEAYIVGEIWELRRDVIDGTTFDGLMNYPVGGAIVGFVTGSRLDRRVIAQHAELARQVHPLDASAFLERVDDAVHHYPPAFAQSVLNLLGSHDTPRFRSMAGGDLASCRLAFLALLTLPGAPCVYYGDEIGLAGEMDPACRGSFPWDTSDWDHQLLEYVRALIGIRRSTPALRSPQWRAIGANGMAAAYLRGRDGPGSVAVGINAGETDVTLELDLEPAQATLRELPLPGGEPAEEPGVEVGDGRLTLRARSGRLIGIG
jgi:cyclomaltodextrinase